MKASEKGQKPEMLTEFKHPKDEVVNSLIKELKRVINNSKVLTGGNKEALLKELEIDNYYNRPNYNHLRSFDSMLFIREIAEYAVESWKRENQGLSDLWKQAALNAANHSEEPHEIADDLVSRYMDNFVYLNKQQN